LLEEVKIELESGVNATSSKHPFSFKAGNSVFRQLYPSETACHMFYPLYTVARWQMLILPTLFCSVQVRVLESSLMMTEYESKALTEAH
jgi:hypothetical protein